ncbi:uncharacterized protein B0I36DRAFT_432702 [Microdochium trichocladiopsis]|uniref:Uncharacterized protein n=1 Tax=Microdochium trichocladiopsis TaxID=1682393 RepID=A0A9P8Y4G5_9PEZI|nr:uncharacterized protein B0I36DRAFT_432702 [Microdochium trichocladiopsis]KAH7027440.1 hypothetical protein B0I36DRAFT_432702 [Microdochium trichocladiopsis]
MSVLEDLAVCLERPSPGCLRKLELPRPAEVVPSQQTEGCPQGCWPLKSAGSRWPAWSQPDLLVLAIHGCQPWKPAQDGVWSPQSGSSGHLFSPWCPSAARQGLAGVQVPSLAKEPSNASTSTWAPMMKAGPPVVPASLSKWLRAAPGDVYTSLHKAGHLITGSRHGDPESRKCLLSRNQAAMKDHTLLMCEWACQGHVSVLFLSSPPSLAQHDDTSDPVEVYMGMTTRP